MDTVQCASCDFQQHFDSSEQLGSVDAAAADVVADYAVADFAAAAAGSAVVAAVAGMPCFPLPQRAQTWERTPHFEPSGLESSGPAALWEQRALAVEAHSA